MLCITGAPGRGQRFAAARAWGGQRGAAWGRARRPLRLHLHQGPPGAAARRHHDPLGCGGQLRGRHPGHTGAQAEGISEAGCKQSNMVQSAGLVEGWWCLYLQVPVRHSPPTCLLVLRGSACATVRSTVITAHRVLCPVVLLHKSCNAHPISNMWYLASRPAHPNDPWCHTSQVKVTTVDGPVELKIPAGTQPGTTLLMAKRGVPRLGSPTTRGDHQVRAGTAVCLALPCSALPCPHIPSSMRCGTSLSLLGTGYGGVVGWGRSRGWGVAKVSNV